MDTYSPMQGRCPIYCVISTDGSNFSICYAHTMGDPAEACPGNNTTMQGYSAETFTKHAHPSTPVIDYRAVDQSAVLTAVCGSGTAIGDGIQECNYRARHTLPELLNQAASLGAHVTTVEQLQTTA